MLDDMSVSVDEHMQEEKEAFKKFDCYCSKTNSQLDASIASHQEKIPQLQSSVEESASVISQLKSDLEEHSAAKEAAKDAIQEQAQLRDTEKKKFQSDSTDMSTNIKNLNQAIKVLKKVQKSSSLLQISDVTSTTQQAKSLLQTISVDTLRGNEREQLVSCLDRLEKTSTGLLSGEASDEVEDLSTATQDVSEIVGMLEQMLEDMEEDLKDMVKAEGESKAQAEALTEAKKKEMATLQATIEDKHKRLSDTEVEKVQLQNDLSSSQRGLSSDSKLLSDLKVQCASKKTEYEALKESLQNELTAIRQTTQILSADDASDVLSRTSAGKSASFLQVASTATSHRVKQAAAAVADTLQDITSTSPSSPSVALLARQATVAAQTARRQPADPHGLGKITQLVVQMTEVLKKEQEDDKLKKQMCDGELTRNDKRSKGLGESIEAQAANIGSAEVERDGVQKDINTLRKGISDLDVSVKEATTRRKAGHEEFVKVMADLTEAIELLRAARDRLGDFYKKSESLLQESQDVTSGEGQDDSSLLALDNGDSEDQNSTGPNNQAARKTRGLGVIGFIEKIEKDVQEELKEEKAAEQNDQTQYETFIAEAGEKRETDTQTLSVRVSTLAEVTEKHRVLTQRQKTLRGELENTKKVIANLHKECDWLVKNYKERETKRAAEAEALSKAQSVLATSGAKAFAEVRKHGK